MNFLKSILGLGLLLPLLGCGAVDDYGSAVKVELKNQSGLAIAQVKVIQMSGGENPEALAVLAVAEDLAPQEEEVLRLNDFEGEGSYGLEVTFEDGTMLAGGGSYVEPGYRMEETILAEKIETDYK